jgi:hypothetical protein
MTKFDDGSVANGNLVVEIRDYTVLFFHQNAPALRVE